MMDDATCAPVTVTAAFVRVQDVRLEVQRITPAVALPRAPIVFLHEGLGSVSTWRDWPAEVCAATGRMGVVVSRRGYGQSDAITDVRRAGRLGADYMHHEAWDVLPALLAATGITRPVLLGHSDGGSIALLHASRHEVAACIVMAPHIVVEDVSVSAITQARADYEHGDLRRGLMRHHADVDCAFWQWNDVWLSEAFRSFDIQADCRRIVAPLLCIQGEDDLYGTMRQIDGIHSTGPRTLLKLAHCAHAPHREQAAATIQAIAAFLQGV